MLEENIEFKLVENGRQSTEDFHFEYTYFSIRVFDRRIILFDEDSLHKLNSLMKKKRK